MQRNTPLHHFLCLMLHKRKTDIAQKIEFSSSNIRQGYPCLLQAGEELPLPPYA